MSVWERPLSRLLRALLLVALSSTAAAETAASTPPSSERALSRPLLAATLEGIGDFAATPLRLRGGNWAWVLPAGLALGVVLNNDIPLYEFMAGPSARREWLDHSMPAVSALGDGLTEFGVAALLNAAGDARLARTSGTAMQALLVSAVWSQAFKFAAWSNRPYQDATAHRFFDYGQDTTGFPSGHSWSAFAAAEVYGAEYGRFWTYPFALLVAYSRVYNRDHWPSDVLAGSMLGILSAVQARRAAEAKGPPRVQFRFRQDGPRSLLTCDASY